MYDKERIDIDWAGGPYPDGRSDMLNEIYNRKILAYAAEIPLTGRLDQPDATAMVQARLCGSKITVDLIVKNGAVVEFAHDVKACALGQAAASIVARHIIGTPVDELRNLRDKMYAMLKEDGAAPTGKWQEFIILEPVRDFKARHASTLLVFDAVCACLDQLAVEEAVSAAGKTS